MKSLSFLGVQSGQKCPIQISATKQYVRHTNISQYAQTSQTVEAEPQAGARGHEPQQGDEGVPTGQKATPYTRRKLILCCDVNYHYHSCR